MTSLLVTGGCGFIGSNFINRYFKNVSFLANVDAMYYCANEKNVDIEIRESEKYKLVKGNLCDTDLVNHVLNTYNITHVIHFAAQSHVQNSFEDSIQYTKDNIVGTHTLLECCRKYGKIEKFVHVSTDEVYGESILDEDEKHKTEHSLLCPSNPYAATKAAAELIAQSYYHSFNMPIIITRGNNVYGPNQYPEKLISRFIELLNQDKKVTIQGDGSNVRAFLHVDDTTRAFECILKKGTIGEIYNIGCDEGMEYSVLDVAKMLIKMMKHTDNCEEWIEYIEDRPFNDKRYYISNEKVKKLGWEIKVNFEDGIQKLIYHELYGKYDIKQVNTNVDDNVYEVFVFCSGKCGSSTLHRTFLENGYKSLHVHSNYHWQLSLNKKESIFDIIEKSKKHYGNVFIIDSYRTPIERKISAFFQHIHIHIKEPSVDTLTTEEIIQIFNDKYVNELEEYHSINEILCYYNIEPIINFDFEKMYIKIEKDNLVIIKMLFNDINNWGNCLSEIFDKNITLFNDNMSENKEYNKIYKDFLTKYKVPKSYLTDILPFDKSFKIFNTLNEKNEYIEKWTNKSF